LSQVFPLNALSIGEAARSRKRLHFLARRRYQLIGGWLIAVVVPTIVNPAFNPLNPQIGGVELTATGIFVALTVGAFLFWRMAAFPGASPLSLVLPAFTAPYIAVVIFFFFARLDYSRAQFLASFVLGIGWFGFVGALQPRLRRARLLLVPFGQASNLSIRTEADWIIGDSPDDIPSQVNGVVADLGASLPSGWDRLLARASLEGLPVYHWKQVAESLSGMVDIEKLSENNLGSLLPSSIYFKFKVTVDIIAAVLALPVIIIVLAIAAAAIVLTDGGPVLFRQVRMGFGGRTFTMLKLRTMRSGSEVTGGAYTIEDDPRITKVGRVLRRYRLDELPQIFNVLRGEMSWIGPRPESVQLASWYEREVPFYSYRHIVRPGISGWAQVHQGNVAEIQAAHDKLRYDFYYIKYFSPWLDAIVAARTIRTVLTGFGSR
jgi:lipopolysaccharide/colanic/teichoic acid biosynthesis glycosyltransferase